MEDMKNRRSANRASEATELNPEERGKRKQKPKFEPPKVITYSGANILEELGPAHACSPFSGAVVGC